MKIKNNQPPGLSSLLLVLIGGFLIILITMAIQLNTLVAAKRAAQAQQNQVAYFAAEGALNETIEHLRQYPEWPDLTGGDDITHYNIGGSEIRRIISETSPGLIEITIETTYRGTKRKIVANFERETREQTPLDIMLVIDRSGSMYGDPLKEAKKAAISFIKFAELTTNDQIGLVSYATNASLNNHLDFRTSAYLTTLENSINNLSAASKTNLSQAISIAKEELDQESRESVKLIIILSDGVANRTADDFACPDYDCLNPNIANPNAPQNDSGVYSGNTCTNETIASASLAKNKYYVFSIFLTNITESNCNYNNPTRCPYPIPPNPDSECLPSTEELGRRTLKEIASQEIPPFYQETKNPEDLTPIYEQIVELITSPEFLEIREELPEPELVP